MSYPEFKNAVESMGKKLNWQLKLSVAQLNPEFKPEDYPLHKSISDSDETQVFRMSDAMALKEMAGSK